MLKNLHARRVVFFCDKIRTNLCRVSSASAQCDVAKMWEQLDALYEYAQPENKLLTYPEAMQNELSRILIYLKQL